MTGGQPLPVEDAASQIPTEAKVANRVFRPFFSFYGGKWRDTPRYYPAPEHKTIVEPFAGSAGYSVRYFDRQVILAEKDPIVFGVWDFLIRAKPADILKIPDVHSGETVADLAISQEARWLVGFWLNRAVSRPRLSPSAWMREGIRPGSFWGERVRQTIASQVSRISHWKVYNCSYERVPRRGAATWFIDPPYQAQGKHYHHGADELDFAALAQWSRARPGQVIVCEQSGAEWLPFKPLAQTKTTRTGQRSHEMLWVRGSSTDANADS